MCVCKCEREREGVGTHVQKKAMSFATVLLGSKKEREHDQTFGLVILFSFVRHDF